MKFWKNQPQHFVLLLTLISTLIYVTHHFHLLGGTGLFGIPNLVYFWIGTSIPILHQLFVLIIWRLELNNHKLSSKFGLKKAFVRYGVGFKLLIISRVITVLLMALSTSRTLHVNSLFSYIIAAVLFSVFIYVAYSVKKYFGFMRVIGIDHFVERFRNMPFVRGGIFKYSSNAMYAFGFSLIWVPGFLFLSKPALLLALFNHVYIWVHYYCTEKPDMKHIYG